MAGFRFFDVDVGDVTLHCAAAGPEGAPLMICLHGFPEYWAAWREVAKKLAGDFRIVLPDQRGFNLSSKPAGVEAYRAKNMVRDLHGLAEHLSPGRPFVLAGHDWGASIAYAFAFAHPDRLTHLVIANGAHPVCFQRAIIEDEVQRRASQYFHVLRAPGAAEPMAKDDFAKTMKMIAGFSKTDWLTPEEAAEYRRAWAQPGAMEAMLHWYSSSPIAVPKPGEEVDEVPLLAVPKEKVMVRVPHLVIWGDADEALTPACLEGLDQFAPDLTVKHIANAGHWILHEKPAEVANEIRAFVGRT